MPLKKLLVPLLKFGVSAAIIVWLVIQAQRDQSFSRLQAEPKNWPLLALAALAGLAAVSVSIARWWLLVRALGMRFRLLEAFRLGFLGYLLNFVSIGSIGGDVFKALLLARDQPGRRAQAVATVILDRVLGLYSLLVVAAVGIAATGLATIHAGTQLGMVCQATYWAAGLGTLGLGLLLVPAVTSRQVEVRAAGLPLVGSAAASVLAAARVYAGERRVLAAACGLSLVTHACFTASFYLIASGLSGHHPTLAQHVTIVPLGLAAGALPLPLGALGATEYVVDYLYRGFAASTQGLVVTLGYRLITVLIAVIGACLYLVSRKEVSAALDAASNPEALELTPNTVEPAPTAGLKIAA